MDADAEQDGLAELQAEVEADPAVHAAYDDANRRTAMLASMQRIRREARMSQQEVATLMQTSQSAVSDIESGRADPRLRTLQRYARAIKRRLDIAMVDEALPAYEEGTANELWRLVEEKALSPLLTGLSTPTEGGGRTVEALAEEYAHLPPEIVRAILSSLTEKGWVSALYDGQDEVFTLKADAGYVIGVTLHRDNVVGALLDLRRQVIDMHTMPLRDSTRTAVIQTTVEVIRRLYRADHEILGVGVILAGVVETDTGTVRFAPDLRSEQDRWRNVELRGDLESAVEKIDPALLVAVENDANALALREYLLCGEPYVAAVLVSESGAGIGMGSVVEGHVVYGKESSAGEGGHVIVDPNGAECRSGTGHAGCLETVASPRGILERLGIRADSARRVTEGLAVANDRIGRGDKEAAAAFRAAGEAVGGFLAVTMIAQDPTRVAIYGHPALVGDEDPSAECFRVGVEAGLKGGVAKAESFPSRLQWCSLDDRTEVEAAGAAAMQHFLYRPGHWQHTALVSRALR